MVWLRITSAYVLTRALLMVDKLTTILDADGVWSRSSMSPIPPTPKLCVIYGFGLIESFSGAAYAEFRQADTSLWTEPGTKIATARSESLRSLGIQGRSGRSEDDSTSQPNP